MPAGGDRHDRGGHPGIPSSTRKTLLPFTPVWQQDFGDENRARVHRTPWPCEIGGRWQRCRSRTHPSNTAPTYRGSFVAGASSMIECISHSHAVDFFVEWTGIVVAVSGIVYEIASHFLHGRLTVNLPGSSVFECFFTIPAAIAAFVFLALSVQSFQASEYGNGVISMSLAFSCLILIILMFGGFQKWTRNAHLASRFQVGTALFFALLGVMWEIALKTGWTSLFFL